MLTVNGTSLPMSDLSGLRLASSNPTATYPTGTYSTGSSTTPVTTPVTTSTTETPSTSTDPAPAPAAQGSNPSSFWDGVPEFLWSE